MERSKNILFLITLPFRRLFVRRSKKINKVVIVQNAKLGDMVCTTPIFRAVKHKYPSAKLAVIGHKSNKELLDWNVDVDLYIDFNDNWNKTVAILKEFGADFGCVCTPDIDGLKLLFAADVPMVVAPKIENGFCPWETRLYRMFRLFSILVSHRMGSYAPREYLKLLEPIGIYTEDTSKHLGFSPSAGEFVERLISSGLNVGIAVSAGNKIKEWPIDRFAKVADHLVSQHKAKVFLIGGPNDGDRIREVLRFVRRKEHIINMQGLLSIDELKAFISRLGLFIAVDTGPIYIAEAFGVPTVDIVGPMDEREQPPVGRIYRVVVPRRMNPELHIMNARIYNTAEARRQVESIGVEAVTDTVEELLSSMKDNANSK